jgi:hypothetical protein
MKLPYAHSPLKRITLFAVTLLALVFIQTELLLWYGQPLRYALLDSGFTALIISVACYTTLLLYQYYQPGADKRVYRLLYAFVISAIAVTVLDYGLAHLIDSPDYAHFIAQSAPIRYMVLFLVISFVTLISWVLHEHEEKTRAIERHQLADATAKEAELNKLRQQLQPHFLFNSLNSVSALTLSDPTAARKMILQLSEFYRNIVKGQSIESTTLKEEVQQMELYLAIEKIRFGDRLRVTMDIDTACLNHMLPPLILQPIIENAVKYGIYGTTGEITIHVHIESENTQTRITITNPFDPDSGYATTGTGYGVSSVKKRMALQYGRMDLFKTEQRDNTFIATLILP